MPGSQILLVEDSEAIRTALAATLTGVGFRVEARGDGQDLERVLREVAPDLVILDVMLPGRDGFALLAVTRRVSTCGVLMLTARDATADRVRGLSQGADDYLVKPFSMSELVARVHALLRRAAPDGGAVLLGDVTVGVDGVDVRRSGTPIELTSTERRLLVFLLSHRGRVLSKTQILTAVWGYDGFADNVVEVHVSALRRKLEAEGGSRVLHTVRGLGYRLAAEA